MDRRTYYLVIKRKNNDFLPVEWNLTKFYDNENLYTLEGIDSFTRKMSRKDLIEELLLLNLINPTDEFHSFAIIFNSKKKTRELKEGCVFFEDNAVLNEDELIEFLVSNQNDKQLVNEVFNVCNFKLEDDNVKEFKYVLKHLDLFKQKGNNGVKAAFSIFKKLSYENKRTIILRVVDTIIPRLNNKQKENKLKVKNIAKVD